MSKDSNVVLIVEDDQEFIAKLQKILKSTGYIAFSSLNGHSALQQLSDNIGVVDAVILNLSLKGIDGLEVIEAIKTNPQKYGDLPVMVVTNVSSIRIIKEALLRGASSYLLKDQVDSKSLLEELKKCLK